MSILTIVHFNDVYRVSDQKLPGSNETINVAKFAARLDAVRPAQDQGLVLFSGDLFSPSVESTVTRGSHMVPSSFAYQFPPTQIQIGNHDLDFGAGHFGRLVEDSTYPWLLSNIIDETTGAIPTPLKEFAIFVRNGVRVGIIGLVEREWITTVSSWPPNYKWQDMKETALNLSRTLRDPTGHSCDLIIALTHSRLPNDIELAKSLLARVSNSGPSIPSTHGVDILLGGHDHVYYVSKGCTQWENFDPTIPVLGGETDDGILLVKSGTDFREMSVVDIALDDFNNKAIRRRTIKSVTGRKIDILPSDPESPALREILKTLLSTVSKALKEPLCETDASLDCRSHLIRTEESAACNWFADVLMHAYDDSLIMKGYHGADGVLVGAGTFRGDSCYGPGLVTLGDILEILPFQDPMIVVELDGESLWKALEVALSTWPAQEGRFPVVAGFRVRWDSSKPPGERLVDISREAHPSTSHGDTVASHLVPISRDEKSHKYYVVTREYMADGHDGFEALVGKPRIVDEEAGQLFSTIIRKYLLGSQYIRAMQEGVLNNVSYLQEDTQKVLARQVGLTPAQKWKRAAKDALLAERKKRSLHCQDSFSIASTEHMSAVDCFDGAGHRRGKPYDGTKRNEKINLPVISPHLDGRLEDLGRSQ